MFPAVEVDPHLIIFFFFCFLSQAVGGDDEEDEHAPFMRRPFCVYRGHTADLLDLSWSKVREPTELC